MSGLTDTQKQALETLRRTGSGPVTEDRRWRLFHDLFLARVRSTALECTPEVVAREVVAFTDAAIKAYELNLETGNQLYHHRPIADGLGQYECSDCGKRFKSPADAARDHCFETAPNQVSAIEKPEPTCPNAANICGPCEFHHCGLCSGEDCIPF